MTRRYLSNMVNWQRPIVEEAIGLVPHSGIKIDDEPMPVDHSFQLNFGMKDYYQKNRPSLIGECFSVYKEVDDTEFLDASEFWSVYREIYDSEKWRTWVILCKDDDF